MYWLPFFVTFFLCSTPLSHIRFDSYIHGVDLVYLLFGCLVFVSVGEQVVGRYGFFRAIWTGLQRRKSPMWKRSWRSILGFIYRAYMLG